CATAGAAALETGLAQAPAGRERRASGGDDVLDEADARPRLEGAFEPLPGAVLLRLLAHDDEGDARGERGGRDERDRTQLGPGEQVALRLRGGDGARDPLAQRL